jgi:hypothetical protein
MPLSPRQAGRLVEHTLDDDGRDPDGPVAGPVLTGESAPPAALGIPERIGQCRILRLLATGGMGVVYEAEQEHPRRAVAVKVLNRAVAARGRAALRRFEYETQILARLDHPGIARIHEAGTWDEGSGGVPYFVMEFIADACNIIEFAQTHDLNPRQRLELFVQVCDAVQYGHQKGIIHRDLKPANILVQQGSDDEGGGKGGVVIPRTKIIDFGVARAADTDISLTTMHTQAGEVMGTLQYMSPEQCEGDPHAIDVRSDVYALGVILYELLCEERPYDLSATPLPRAARVITDQEPMRPSTLRAALKGDLEAITLKALAKSPAGRYQSVADLARDVRGFLAGEPIEARRPGVWFRFIRLVGRHPLLVTALACCTVLTLTFVATMFSVWFLNVRPHHVERTPDDREARLVSLDGHILHTWTATGLGRIRFATLIRRDDGGDPLAVLAFNNQQEGPWRGAVCAFNVADPDEPVWLGRITDDDLFPALHDRGIDVAGFSATWAMTADAFRDIPGPEIVVGYSHAPHSVAAVVIYDLSGRPLNRIWHDGPTNAAYWMDEVGLLALSGLNAEVDLPQRGYPNAKEAHPAVVFAVRPRLGHLARGWTTPSEGGEMSGVAWYQCLLPADEGALVSQPQVIPPLPQYDAGRFVGFRLYLGDQRSAVSWTLDASGNEVPGSRSPNNYWRLDANLPADYFRLGDLPPIRPSETAD